MRFGFRVRLGFGFRVRFSFKVRLEPGENRVQRVDKEMAHICEGKNDRTLKTR